MNGLIAEIGMERKARCVWCCAEKPGVDVTFKDGLKGFLCWPDVRRAVKVRSEKGTGTEKDDV